LGTSLGGISFAAIRESVSMTAAIVTVLTPGHACHHAQALAVDCGHIQISQLCADLRRLCHSSAATQIGG
jgi:hypothetical protein